MTARDMWDAVHIELNKIQAPTLLVEDFNYLANKSIDQYVNKRYTQFDVSQQLSDDLRVLKKTIHVAPVVCNAVGETEEQRAAINALYGATYELFLPVDYRHLLNCLCSFKEIKTTKEKVCKNTEDDLYSQFPAVRLSTDLWPEIKKNRYTGPSHTRPYYYIHSANQNFGTTLTTDTEYLSDTKSALKSRNSENNTNSYSRTIVLGGGSSLVNTIRTEIGNIDNDLNIITRVENPDPVRMEIRCGNDSKKYKLVDVQIDYLRTPQYIQLTQTQLDLIPDTSQILEWPRYVCDQIINELVHLIMENSSDQRLQTHMPIVNSIS